MANEIIRLVHTIFQTKYIRYYFSVLIVAWCCTNLSTQAQDTMSLAIIKPGDELFPRLSKKLRSSIFPTIPICKEGDLQLTNKSSSHTIFRHRLNLTYSTSLDLDSTLVEFKILLDEADENPRFAREGSLYEGDKWQKFKDNKLLTSFQFGVHTVHIELILHDINLLRHCEMGGIHFKLLNIYHTQAPAAFGKKTILIKDDVTGVQFLLDSMYIGSTPLQSVTLGESFRFRDDWYRFAAFYPNKNSLILERLARAHRPIGYRQGYYVDRAAMLKQLGLPADNQQKIALYFWGAWCHPCVQHFPSTLSLYQQAAKEKNIHSCFVSYDGEDTDYPKTADFLQQYELGEVNIKSTFGNDMSAIEKFTSSHSLLAQLKIHFFPSYVLIDEDGQILFNNTKREGLRELMGL